MTREEEINLLCKHLAKVWYAGANHNLEALFDQAVQWADEHPKNPWRKTEDKLPPSPKGYYHEWVLVKMDKRDDTPFTAFYKKAIDKWFTDGEFGHKEIARPEVWMPIPPSEGGEV